MSISETKSRYKGDVLNCIKHGQGTYDYPGGVYSYNGLWNNGVKHGNQCSFMISNYSTYEGDIQHGEITGNGKRVWMDGREYTGEWKDGEMHGKGIWKSSDGKEIYEGEFRDNKRHGNGHLRLSNGDTYMGEFDTHKCHGRGSYLSEHSLFVESDYQSGVMEGQCNIQWHKTASYAGSVRNGMLDGLGHFVTQDGGYEFEGNFHEGFPVYEVGGVSVKLDRGKVTEPEAGKKDKKKKPAGKKGQNEPETMASVPPGGEIGQVIVGVKYDDDGVSVATGGSQTSQEPTAGVCIHLPNANELRRKFNLRMRNYIPPPPPGKGESPPEPDPEKELGDIVPLWRRNLTLEEAACAWDRFPVRCLRYVSGVNILTGEQVVAEGDATQFIQQESGIIAAKVLADSNSSVSITLQPADMAGATELLSFIADFLIQVASLVDCKESLVEGQVYRVIPVVSLSHMLGGLEGKSRMDLVLLVPAEYVRSQQEDAEGSEEEKKPEEVVWSKCVWELRLCQKPNMPLASESDQCGEGNQASIAQENREDNGTTEGDGTTEDNGTTESNGTTEGNGTTEQNGTAEQNNGTPEEDITVLSRWSDASSFDPSAWHSIALTLHKQRVDASSGEAPSSPSSSSLVELTVDGAGRMKMEGQSAEGTAAAWLPEHSAAPSEESDSVSMIYRVGYGAGFGGLVKNIAVCTKNDRCDLQKATSCFSERDRREREINARIDSTLGENSPSGDEENHVIPPQFEPVDCIEFLSCGGRAVIDGLVVPSNTPPGTYVLEVYDVIDEKCVKREVDPQTPSGSFSDAMQRVKEFSRVIPLVGSSNMTYKITVSAV
mmetsp:Transcript_2309/g.3546  ORF Transcript_2309/g.3546 Transcript_2309/m.3546 type:complete len:828 (+) Transcript_2309:120-2603(+)